jgi:hypothetical protein
MKFSVLVVLIGLVAILGSLFIGCSSSTSGYFIEMLKLLPQDTEALMHFDLELMAKDPDLVEMYYSITDGAEIIRNRVGQGIDIQAYTLAMFPNWETVIIVKGNFNKTDVCNTLKEQAFVSGEYEGIEIWIENSQAVTFIREMIVFGNTQYVEASIRISQDMEVSLYDYEDVKSVSDKLPQAIKTELYYGEEAGIGEALCGGISMRNLTRGDDVVDIECWFKFRSETDAETALQSLEEQISDYYNATNTEGQLRGVFVEITADGELPTE